MAASYSYFLLAILDLGIRLQLGHGRGICIVDEFILCIDLFIFLNKKKFIKKGYQCVRGRACY